MITMILMTMTTKIAFRKSKEHGGTPISLNDNDNDNDDYGRTFVISLVSEAAFVLIPGLPSLRF